MRLVSLVCCLLAVCAACTPSKKKVLTDEEQILLKYAQLTEDGEVLDEDAILSRISTERGRLHLAIWVNEKLKGANLVITLQMTRRTAKEMSRIQDALKGIHSPMEPGAREQRHKLLADLELESARFVLLKSHFPTAPLPDDAGRRYEDWRSTALADANQDSLEEMKMSAARRIKFLEDSIAELKTHPQDLVWDHYLKLQLQLRIVALKLRDIEAQLGGLG